MNKTPCTRAATICATPLLDLLPLPFRKGRGVASTTAILLFLAVAGSASAQSYSIDWHKVAGGGGTSTNGQYSLSGAMGQPEAGGPMTNGQYSVTGGFWVLPQAVQ